ncbi:MAG: nucleotidyltransferase family protein [Anaerolineae bacterium]
MTFVSLPPQTLPLCARPERAPHSLLRTLLRSQWDAASAARIDTELRTAAAAIDWDALVEAAQGARVMPLVYHIVRERDWLPAPALERLRMAYFATARRNLLAFHALGQAIAHLNAHGIPTLLLKGVALALALYKNEALRPMGDADLLIPREDVPRAVALLRELGYTTPIPEVRPGARLDYDGELFLQSDVAHAAPIDLHWNLVNAPNYRRSAAEAWLWESAQPVTVGAAAGRVLSDEAQLIHLCAHKVLHHNETDADATGLWTYDIARLLAEHTLDWDVVLAQAQALRMIAPLQQALPVITAAWGVPLPETVMARLAALEPTRAERRLLQRASGRKAAGVRSVWTNLWAMPNVWAAMRYVWHMAFPSLTYMREHYRMPSVMWLPVYYVRRWLRGIRA